MIKELSHVMMELHNVRIEPSSMRKKVRKPPNVIKELSYVMLEPHNVRMELSNVRKKSKGTTKCEKRTVICDVGTAQYKDGTVKCEKKITWCIRLPISGYRRITHQKHSNNIT